MVWLNRVGVETHRFLWSDGGGGDFLHSGAVAVAGGAGRGTEVLLVGVAGPPRAAGAQRAVALRAAAVHRLHQEPVDPLAQLDDVGRGHPALAAHRWREDIFIQGAPKNIEGSGNETLTWKYLLNIKTL